MRCLTREVGFGTRSARARLQAVAHRTGASGVGANFCAIDTTSAVGIAIAVVAVCTDVAVESDLRTGSSRTGGASGVGANFCAIDTTSAVGIAIAVVAVCTDVAVESDLRTGSSRTGFAGGAVAVVGMVANRTHCSRA